VSSADPATAERERLPDEAPEPKDDERAEKPRKNKPPKTVARADQAQTAGLSTRPIDVTIIVPVVSGDGRVRDVTQALSAELERLGKSWECILVFDGVRGRAWEEAQELAREHPARVLPIAFQQPSGESTCLTAAFERSRGGIIVTSPQYVQVDPFELSQMLAALSAGADFVSPWRHPRIDPYLNRLQSSLFNWVMRRIIQSPFHDLNCYFRAFKRQVLEEVAIYGDQYRFLPAIALRQGFKVVELKVRHLKEWGGSGFFGLGVYARRAIDILGVVFLSRFTLKPLRFFGALGGSFALLGGAMCLIMLVQHLFFTPEGALITRQWFLVGLLLFVLGVQIIGFGLVGEIIIYTQARNLREYRIERIWEAGPPTQRDGPQSPREDSGDDGARP
jgi:glycosyltransferase involved in cell wall biosynthesis